MGNAKRMVGWWLGLTGLAVGLGLTGCGGGGGGGGTGGDTLPPVISGVQVVPSRLRFVGGEVEVQARVDDPSGVGAVWMEVQKPDGVREQVGMSASGGVYYGVYRVSANTRTDGQEEEYRLQVRARDRLGNEGMSSEVVLTVPAPSQPPGPPEEF